MSESLLAVGTDIESIVYGSYVVDNAQLSATLENGVLDLSKLAGGMFGGVLRTGALAGDGGVTVSQQPL